MQRSKLQSFVSLQIHNIKRRQNHLPHCCIKLPSPTGKVVYHSSNQKRLKIVLHKELAISQWSKRWSTNYPLFLHMQHQSTTMICCLLRLSIVRIFPKAVDDSEPYCQNTLPRDLKSKYKKAQKGPDLSNFFFFFFFDVEEPLQDRALWTHPCRVNPGPVHRTLGSFPTRNWLSRWLFTRGCGPKRLFAPMKS
jgi:hypothetical protein